MFKAIKNALFSATAGGAWAVSRGTKCGNPHRAVRVTYDDTAVRFQEAYYADAEDGTFMEFLRMLKDQKRMLAAAIMHEDAGTMADMRYVGIRPVYASGHTADELELIVPSDAKRADVEPFLPLCRSAAAGAYAASLGVVYA